MTISRDALRGYILEEVLAYLISGTGYKLLVDADQDSDNLVMRGNGLGVKGRGGDHQVDVLGELQWIPAFTFPLRLFVEAKFRNGRTGISVVDKAVGVLLDINQRNMVEREQVEFPRYYRYEYALFSISGFSPRAINMAITHQISLIDLSGDEFEDLRDKITKSADMIIRTIEQRSEFQGEDVHNRGRLVLSVRNGLRIKLRTWPTEVPQTLDDYYIQVIDDALYHAIQVAHDYRELFVAMADGPFMLLLKERTPGEFVRYANRYRRHDVDIHWSRYEDDGRTWTINPTDDSDAYSLSFRLPEALSEWIFSRSDFARRRALRVKQNYFSNITIYRYVDGEDYLYRLTYNRERLAETWER